MTITQLKLAYSQRNSLDIDKISLIKDRSNIFVNDYDQQFLEKYSNISRS